MAVVRVLQTYAQQLWHTRVKLILHMFGTLVYQAPNAVDALQLGKKGASRSVPTMQANVQLTSGVG